MEDINTILDAVKETFGDDVVFHEKKEDFYIMAKESMENFHSWVEACGYNDEVFKLFALHSAKTFEVLLDNSNGEVKIGAIGSFPSKDGGVIEVGIGMPLTFTLSKEEKLEATEFLLDAILLMLHLAGKLDSFLENPVYVDKVRLFAKAYHLI